MGNLYLIEQDEEFFYPVKLNDSQAAFFHYLDSLGIIPDGIRLHDLGECAEIVDLTEEV